ncbi:type II toxin-antitoxin system RelE/ParE family toxin [Asticcacaulis sp. MM231]|uniref:type II toxin-antitoxin system RelE/ParE family toxin n=1 Tax=Asticcacaulis sp. MM231 TaxID=3157666 RepID=UPI0032D59570
MADYRLSRKAEADLAAIADYSLQVFGIQRARSYRDDLLKAFAHIASNPNLGTYYGHIAPDTRRFVTGSHVIYYRMLPDGLLIRRILH